MEIEIGPLLLVAMRPLLLVGVLLLRAVLILAIVICGNWASICCNLGSFRCSNAALHVLIPLPGKRERGNKLANSSYCLLVNFDPFFLADDGATGAGETGEAGRCFLADDGATGAGEVGGLLGSADKNPFWKW